LVRRKSKQNEYTHTTFLFGESLAENLGKGCKLLGRQQARSVLVKDPAQDQVEREGKTNKKKHPKPHPK
jgi:hypothetical protein